MIFVPLGSSPPPHSLVTKSTGTSSERIISEGQHIAAQAAGKAPKFTSWTNNPVPIARSGDSIVVPHRPVLAFAQSSGTRVPPRERPVRPWTPTSLGEMPSQPKVPCR